MSEEPTEKSQIVIAHTVAIPNLIVRFRTVEKGKKVFKKMKDAWDLCKGRGGGPLLFDVDSDMFVSTVDLSCISSISFVDHAVRTKFIPK